MMMEIDDSESKIIKIKPPKKADVWAIRLLICCGLLSMICFIYWFFGPDHVGYAPLYYLLTFALFFKLLKMVHEWYHYWSVTVPEKPEWKTKWTVDVLTTSCPGEPREMIIRTLKAMKAIKYPHTDYLCDEGDDPILKDVCKELGVVHVTRIKKIDAKAGNINNALRQATGDICVVLDPDHVPVPEFLHRVLPYFENPEIGFVQCVQAYSNQSESYIARGAAEQTYHFYGPMMMCMHTYGTVQAIGANCTFRRKALDSIGGHAAGLAEDMHTSMQLNAKGWKSVYVPEALTRGLVPATLSAYYKQQLKWSRGAFELLFRTYPSLFKRLDWRQKVHYLTVPLYFLFGLINFIDILIPTLALCLAETPWSVNINHFALFFLPLFGISLLIRMYAQQWLLEKSERGFHIAGGVIRTSSWWVLLIGFIYAIFNIKVPYIPTPKEDEHENYIKLCMPNIAVVVIGLAGTAYGLSIDWTPYSIAMASYGLVTMIMLSFVVLISQQRFLSQCERKIREHITINKLWEGLKNIAEEMQALMYVVFKDKSVALSIGVGLLFLSYVNIDTAVKISENNKQKEFGGFYAGIYVPKEKIAINRIDSLQRSFNAAQLISYTQSWDTNEQDAYEMWKKISVHGAIPVMNWEPQSCDTEINMLWHQISTGLYDSYLTKYAEMLRIYREPLFINFAPGFDDSLRYANVSGKEFIKAWQYVYTFFNNLGISNATWVWSPKYNSSFEYYPGPKFVDWIGVSCLNGVDKSEHSFSELFSPYAASLNKLQKPVMITEFGSVTGQKSWITKGLDEIRKKFTLIRSVIFFDGQKQVPVRYDANRDYNIVDFNYREEGVFKTVQNDLEQEIPGDRALYKNETNYLSVRTEKYRSPFVTGGPGKFKLLIDGKPWYIRGVSYNTEHDWRDGHMPLTRKQLERDFSRIKEMGANTIRRYDHGVYDRNILNIAAEYDLKVLYGFWFDPKVDYYRDSLRVKKYIREVEDLVLQYKDHPAVLAWSLGNESWGLLKHKFSKPYLVKVREQYVNLIEYLARRIHELDPTRPVFSCMEHEKYQLPGELVAFRDGAPSVDVMGINSYYKEQISKLNYVTHQFDSLRPYLVSEFGARGYWDPDYNRYRDGAIIEDNEKEKAWWYTYQWEQYVKMYEGYNVGGFAYCWHDRMEGSNTWFGLTDYRGRPKPPYYALKKLWTGTKTENVPQYMISHPSSITAGGECSFTAVALNDMKDEYTYEWYLHKNEYLERINSVESREDGHIVNVTIPTEPANYRLYLYVSNKKGDVATASFPIRVMPSRK